MADSNGSFLSSVGAAGMGYQVGASSVGAYYATLARRSDYRMQESAFNHQSTLAAMAASQAERDSWEVLKASRERAGIVRLQAAQEQANFMASRAASGVDVSSGSAAEVRVSQQWASDTDQLTIRREALREMQARRAQATNLRFRSGGLRTRALVAGVNSRLAQPGAAAGITLLGNAASVAAQYARYSS